MGESFGIYQMEFDELIMPQYNKFIKLIQTNYRLVSQNWHGFAYWLKD